MRDFFSATSWRHSQIHFSQVVDEMSGFFRDKLTRFVIFPRSVDEMHKFFCDRLMKFVFSLQPHDEICSLNTTAIDEILISWLFNKIFSAIDEISIIFSTDRRNSRPPPPSLLTKFVALFCNRLTKLTVLFRELLMKFVVLFGDRSTKFTGFFRDRFREVCYRLRLFPIDELIFRKSANK